MKLTLESPTKLRIEDPSELELQGLQSYLSYRNSSIAYQIMKWKKNFFLRKKYGDEFINRKIAELEPHLISSLLYTDEKGLYTLSGVADDISKRFRTSVQNNIKYPEFDSVPYYNEPEFTPKDYQDSTVDAFVANPHSHAELATGLGKSFIIMLMLKKTSLPTVVVTPSKSIARQLYEDALKLFGKKYVGLYGDGRKDIGKKFLICIGKSLAMIEDKETTEDFKQYQVFLSDESHTLGADLFAKFALGVLGHCPYRWFLSATQERTDGSDLLLSGIIGKQVYSKTIQDGIKEGHLAKLSTLIFDVVSPSPYTGDNMLKMNQKHIYQNEVIIKLVAQVTNQAVANNMPVLILIDEIEQEEFLRGHMRVPYAFAQGKSDVNQIVKDFNEGKIMCVIGTSAVSTGTNFKPVQLTINWKANKAGTKVKQGAIGRSTRLDERTGKTSAKIIDFRVLNVGTLKKHSDIRISYYKDVGEVTYVKHGAAKDYHKLQGLGS